MVGGCVARLCRWVGTDEWKERGLYLLKPSAVGLASLPSLGGALLPSAPCGVRIPQEAVICALGEGAPQDLARSKMQAPRLLEPFGLPYLSFEGKNMLRECSALGHTP